MSSSKDSLGDRMKKYESVSRNFLTRRIPVIIRVDGKAFHSFTRGMRRPFDDLFHNVMNLTMKGLCSNIQGCVFGYTQSDEITLVLTDYATISTDAWFGYNVQKMTSIAASMATCYFNRIFAEELDAAIQEFPDDETEDPSEWDYLMKLQKKMFQAVFDARAFSVPKDEVCNCLIWRQQDATRNSIEGAGQAYFSHSQLHKKTTNQIQDMLFKEKGINWNDYLIAYKRGVCCYKVEQFIPCANGTQVRYPEGCVDPVDDSEVETGVYRKKWIIDPEPPIFTQDREYIERWL